MRSSNPSLWATAPGRLEIRSAARTSLAAGEVLVRTRRTLISPGTELAILEGAASPGSSWSEFARFPRPMGYSHSGEVTAVGEGVDRSWIGRRVATRGPHAAWVTRPQADLRPVPDTVCDEQAAFATLAAVVMNGLRRARLRWGESVAVFGLGLVGQLAVRLAAASGAGPVFGLELSPSRLDRLIREPLVYGLAGGDLEAALERARELNHGRRMDLAVEASGEPGLIPKEIDWLRDQGRLLLLSSPRGSTSFDFHDLCNRRSLTLVGAHGFSQPPMATPDNPWTSTRHGELFLAWLAAGRLTVAELITHRLPFDRAAAAYDLLAEEGGGALGVILEWT